MHITVVFRGQWLLVKHTDSNHLNMPKLICPKPLSPWHSKHDGAKDIMSSGLGMSNYFYMNVFQSVLVCSRHYQNLEKCPFVHLCDSLYIIF